MGDMATESNLPSMVFRNETMDQRKLAQIVKECYDLYGSARTAVIVNSIKKLGFHYATKAGVTIAAMDIKTPAGKAPIIAEAERAVEEIDLQYRRGLITDDERYLKTVEIWTKATDDVTKVTMSSFDKFHSVLMMSQSGARGSTQQIRQLAGMRGLMADPTGRIIDLPIKANFSEGLTVLEYFISTHGARKGLADTALRTADSGYLTRRLVDVAQDVIVRIEDCETTAGIWIELEDDELKERVIERYAGRIAAQDIVLGDELLLSTGEEISDENARRIFAERARLPRVKVRSIMTCKAREGVCRACYGRNLATGRMVEIGEAVGRHRRPVDRRAGHPAHHADLPHRWCRHRRRRHHPGSSPGGGAVRGPGPQGQGADRRDRRRGGGHPRRQQVAQGQDLLPRRVRLHLPGAAAALGDGRGRPAGRPRASS